MMMLESFQNFQLIHAECIPFLKPKDYIDINSKSQIKQKDKNIKASYLKFDKSDPLYEIEKKKYMEKIKNDFQKDKNHFSDIL